MIWRIFEYHDSLLIVDMAAVGCGVVGVVGVAIVVVVAGAVVVLEVGFVNDPQALNTQK